MADILSEIKENFAGGTTFDWQQGPISHISALRRNNEIPEKNGRIAKKKLDHRHFGWQDKGADRLSRTLFLRPFGAVGSLNT